MKKRKYIDLLDSLTLFLWTMVRIGAVLAFRLLIAMFKILALLYTVLISEIKFFEDMGKRSASLRKHAATAMDGINVFENFTAAAEKIDSKMKKSPLARRFFFIIVFFLALLHFNPPEFWGTWHLYEKGTASYYGRGFYMKRTASGEWFLPFGGLTAAHKHLPLGTNVLVKNMSNGRKVVVRINDRGPFVGERMIDLSVAAAKKLEMKEDGLAEVQIFTRKNQFNKK